MNNSSSDFDRFLSPDNFKLAWQRLIVSTRINVKHRLGISVLSASLDEQLHILMTAIENNSFTPAISYSLYEPKSDGTLRNFSYLSMWDRLVYQAIGNIILENAYSDLKVVADKQVFAHIPTDRTSNGNFDQYMFKNTKTIKDNLGQYDKYRKAVKDHAIRVIKENKSPYVVKSDISSYYYSIDHGVLIEMIRAKNWLTDERLIDLFTKCLSRWVENNNSKRLSQGIPVGYETSDLLATLFLFDLDLFLQKEFESVRFVDDIYIFAQNEKEGIKCLIDYDLFLQEKALIRNSAKTKLIPCNQEFLLEIDDEYKFRKNLSFIDVTLKWGTPEDSQFSQEELLIELMRIIAKDNQNQEFLRENEAIIAFILYRIDVKREDIRDFALRYLEQFPHRAFNATHYLKKFDQDEIVAETLLKYLNEPIGYSAVKIACFQALKEIHMYLDQLEKIVVNWCLGDFDWQLKKFAIEECTALQKYNYYLFDFNLKNENPIIRSQALVAYFDTLSDVLAKIETINTALEDEDYFIKLVGYWLWRRESSIERKSLSLDDLPEDIESLFISLEEKTATEKISENFQKLYKFGFNDKLRLHLIFDDLSWATQSLINLNDYKMQKYNEFVIVLGKLVFTLLYQKILLTFPNFEARNLNDLIPKIGDNPILTQHLGGLATQLNQLNSSNEYRINYKTVDLLVSATKVVFAILFDEFHHQQNLSVTAEHRAILIELYDLSDINLKLASTDNEQKGFTFISYSRNDIKYAEHVEKIFIKQGLNTWRDNHLSNSANWRRQIDKALKDCRYLLLIWSLSAYESDEVLSEWNYVLKAGKPVFILTIDEQELMSRLSTIQYNEFSPESIEKICNQIKG